MAKKTKFEVKTTAASNVEPEPAVSRNVNVILNDKKTDHTSCNLIKRVCGC